MALSSTLSKLALGFDSRSNDSTNSQLANKISPKAKKAAARSCSRRSEPSTSSAGTPKEKSLQSSQQPRSFVLSNYQLCKVFFSLCFVYLVCTVSGIAYSNSNSATFAGTTSLTWTTQLQLLLRLRETSLSLSVSLVLFINISIASVVCFLFAFA